MRSTKPIVILMADDDMDDCQMARDALVESRVVNDFHVVGDGEQLMNYLKRRPPYAEAGKAPRPGLILLDLNMPKKSGSEALEEIKTDPLLRQIPIVILTTSRAEEDIFRSYDLGANSFITKPINFLGLVEVMKSLGRYWIEVVERPSKGPVQ